MLLLSFLSLVLILVLLVRSGLVLSLLRLSYCNVRIFVILIALRLACGLLRPSGTWFGLGGSGPVPFWSILFIGWLTS